MGTKHVSIKLSLLGQFVESKIGRQSTMDWYRLMSWYRFRGPDESARPDKSPERRSPFLRDYDRIAYSSAFRRLQHKTQVHPFPETDYVRTRLTHSIEVSSVGRSLALGLGDHIIQRYNLNEKLEGLSRELRPGDFADVVAAACLAHDIGHPPFGHAGEEAIRHWFRLDHSELLEEGCTEEQKADFENFESNAQGFRVLTRLQFSRAKGGMQLSCATLGTFSKYPRGSGGREQSWESERGSRKFGYFQEDRGSFEVVANCLGLLPQDEQQESWSRHPLAYLVEAADDICYLIVDIEDGYKSKRIAFKDVEEALSQIIGDQPSRSAGVDGQEDQIGYLRSKAIGVLVEQTIEVFCHHEPEILCGSFKGALLDRIERSHIVRQIRRLCKEKLYNDERKLKAEIAGFAVVRGLLELYSDALLAWERVRYNITAVPYLYEKIIRLLSGHLGLPRSRYQWLLCLTDYVSGMTDRFAVTQYRMLRGIDLGVEIM